MCLIALGWKTHPVYKLVLLANRDEFYQRETAAAHYWQDTPSVLAGRDLEAGGTWMGFGRPGKFAALTNYRDPFHIRQGAPSRGELTVNYLVGEQNPEDYLKRIAPRAEEYNGFNLLVADSEEVYYFSNYEDKITRLTSGVHGLSNHLLNTSWYKVERIKERLTAHLQANDLDDNQLLASLHDLEKPTDDHVQQTGLSAPQEKMLSSVFIESPDYGTHSSSLVLIDYENKVQFTERRYKIGAEGYEEAVFEFDFMEAIRGD